MVITRLQRVVHVPLLLVLTLWGSRVSADSGCGLDSVREKSCWARQNKTPTSVSAETRGGAGWVWCDFSQDQCSFSAGCPAPNASAPPWTRAQASSRWFMETKVNGSDAKPPSLESPLLHFRLPSCLTFTVSTGNASLLTVFLLDPDRNCTVDTKRVTASDTPQSFQLSVPAGPTQIVFQGSGRGNATDTIRLYSLSTQPQCCTDEDWWSVSKARAAQRPLSADCKWTMELWNNTDNIKQGSVATNSASGNSVTSPVLNATSAGGHVGCLSFEFVLEKHKVVSLSLSLLMGPAFQDPVPEWQMHGTGVSNGSGFGLDFTQGQLPVSTQQSFRVQFRAHSAGRAVVIVSSVSYSTTNSACPLLPAQASVTPQGEEDSAVLIAIIAGGALASAVLVILLVLCVCVCCRQLQRKLRTSRPCGKGSQDVPMRDRGQPDRPGSCTNPYTEITLQDSPLPAADSTPVSGTPIASAPDPQPTAVSPGLLNVTADVSSPAPLTSGRAAESSSGAREKQAHPHGVTVCGAEIQIFPDPAAGSRGDAGTSSSRSCCHHLHHGRRNGGCSVCSQSMKKGPEISSIHEDTRDGLHSRQTQGRTSSKTAAADRPVCTMANSQRNQDRHYYTLETPSANSHSAVPLQEAEERDNTAGQQAGSGSFWSGRTGTSNGGTSALHQSLGDKPQVASPVYDKLGEVKQGMAAKAREKTLRVYDHVGHLNEAVYDTTQRNTRPHVIGCNYDHLNTVFPHKSA